jgi:hypothetical protein
MEHLHCCVLPWVMWLATVRQSLVAYLVYQVRRVL